MLLLRGTLGGQGDRTYTLTTRTPAGSTTRTIPFTNPSFKEIAWPGFTTPEDGDGTIYLDGLKLALTRQVIHPLGSEEPASALPTPAARPAMACMFHQSSS